MFAKLDRHSEPRMQLTHPRFQRIVHPIRWVGSRIHNKLVLEKGDAVSLHNCTVIEPFVHFRLRKDVRSENDKGAMYKYEKTRCRTHHGTNRILRYTNPVRKPGPHSCRLELGTNAVHDHVAKTVGP